MADAEIKPTANWGALVAFAHLFRLRLLFCLENLPVLVLRRAISRWHRCPIHKEAEDSLGKATSSSRLGLWCIMVYEVANVGEEVAHLIQHFKQFGSFTIENFKDLRAFFTPLETMI